MHGPIHLQCPVCGHVFMTSQARSEAAQSCAHCAFVAPGLHFQIVNSAPIAEPISFQKRVARLRPEESTPPLDLEGEVTESAPAPIQRTHLSQTGAQQRIHPNSHPFASDSGGEEIIAPQKKRPYLRWLMTFILFAAVCGVTGLLAWEKIQQRIEIQRQNAAMKAVSADTATRVDPSPVVGATSRLDGSIMTQEVEKDANRLLDLLFSGSSLDQKLTALENPEQHRTEVESFFQNSTTRPQLISVTPISNPPISLREQRRTPMFKVITSQNRSGALAWIIEGKNGGQLIHWPLFLETHQQALRKFLLEKPETPQWFFVGLRRTHPFDLPGDIRGDYEAFDIDGSTDGSGRSTVFIHKKTPLSRTLNGSVQWSEFYYGRVLVSWMDVGGENRFAMLDCENPPDTPNSAQ